MKAREEGRAPEQRPAQNATQVVKITPTLMKTSDAFNIHKLLHVHKNSVKINSIYLHLCTAILI